MEDIYLFLCCIAPKVNTFNRFIKTNSLKLHKAKWSASSSEI